MTGMVILVYVNILVTKKNKFSETEYIYSFLTTGSGLFLLGFNEMG